MGFKNRTQGQIEAAKSGLWIIQERQQLKQMHDSEYGSCKDCVHNDEDFCWQCHDCINGGGTLKLFEQKPRKKIRRR